MSWLIQQTRSHIGDDVVADYATLIADGDEDVVVVDGRRSNFGDGFVSTGSTNGHDAALCDDGAKTDATNGAPHDDADALT